MSAQSTSPTQPAMKTLRHYAKLFQEKTITLPDGHVVFYREANPGAERTVFVVHGITGSHYSMLQMAGVWAEDGLHVIVIDLPGHGKSDRIRAKHFSDIADWLALVIDALVPAKPITLVGNSFGSAVCFSFLSHYSLAEGSKIILGAPTPTISKLSSTLEQLSRLFPEAVLNYAYYRNPLVEFIRMRVLLADLKNDKIRGRLRESLRSEAKIVQHKYAMGLTGLMARDQPFTSTIDPALHESITVVYGDSDKIAGADVGDVIQQLMPAATIIRAENCGHLVHIEAVDALTKAI